MVLMTNKDRTLHAGFGLAEYNSHQNTAYASCETATQVVLFRNSHVPCSEQIWFMQFFFDKNGTGIVV